ncbi:MAG: phytoene desaturase family protein [Parvularculaceae bacterium]
MLNRSENNRRIDCDVIVVGAGHNGLVCAAYLACAGLRVTVVEKRSVIGGAAVTEEFYPGFRNSVASYTVSLLNPKVIADLELARFGLKIVERKMSNFWPFEDGRFLALYPNADAIKREFAKFSDRDARAAAEYYGALERTATIFRRLVLETPPNAGGGLLDMVRAGRLGRDLIHLPIEDQRLLIDIFTKSVNEFVSGYFEAPEIRAACCFDGLIGAYAGPHTPGTAYVLLHHAFGEVNGKKGVWGHAIGGMGAVTQAMAKSAAARGVDIRTDAGVREVIIEDDAARGVVLENGETIRAGIVAANVNPKLLYTQLVDSGALDAEFLRRMKNWKCGSGVLRMNVALSELPDFTCAPGANLQDHHTAGVVIGSSVDYLERAYLDAREHGWARRPLVEILISSTLDDTLAPPGQHVASLFCQSFAPELPDGQSWDDAREDAADAAIDAVTEFAPNFRNSIIAKQVLTPLDLEREFGLLGGDIFHGAMSLDQLYSARPMLGYADYRGPLKGLYHCGSGAHPGGGVTGAPGHNAAREMIRDLKGWNPLRRFG